MRIFALLFLALGALAQGPAHFQHVGIVRHKPASEISGIARSDTHRGIYWVHNDSGDEARLFAINKKGEQAMPDWLRQQYYTDKKEKGKKPWPGYKIHLAANIDWEDIAQADGRLYIAAVGNNGNARRDLGVYVVNEPSLQVPEMRILKFLPVRYPDQKTFPAKLWHFDCESLFVSEGKLYFITKHRQAGMINRGELGAKLYRLDTEHTDRENVLTLVEKRADLVMPTAADLSPDGKRLAVLTLRAVWVFEKPAEGDKWLSGKARWHMLPSKQTKQAEAVTWDDDKTLRIANEQRDLFTIRVADLEAK